MFHTLTGIVVGLEKEKKIICSIIISEDNKGKRMAQEVVNQRVESSTAQTNPQFHPERVFFDLLDKVGSIGRYQKITLVFWSLACYLCGGLSLITPFLFFQDPYLCTGDLSSAGCQDYVCSLPSQERRAFLSQPSMMTLAEKMGDYRCAEEASILSFAILFMYTSTIFAFLILTIFGDFMGRKNAIIIGLIATIGGLAVTLVSPSLFIAAAGLFVALSGAQWAFSISFIFISETVAESHRQQFLVIVQLFYGLGHLGNTGLFYWLRDWQQVFIYFYIIPAALLLIGITLLVVDTPMSLIRRVSSQEALEQMLWIGKINGIEESNLTLQNVEELKQLERTRQSKQKQAQRFTCIDLFKFPSLRKITVFLTILQIAINFLFYAPTLMIADFQFSIFLNGVVLGLASLVSYLFSYLTINKVNRKTMAVVCFAIIFVISIALVFVWDHNNEFLDVNTNIGVLVAFFVISFVITTQYTFFYVYITELYPTQVRVVGYSMVTVLGGVTIAVSDYLITVANNAGFSVMIIFASFALLSLFVSCGLEETLKHPAPDMVIQISDRVIHITAKNLGKRVAGIRNRISIADFLQASHDQLDNAKSKREPAKP